MNRSVRANRLVEHVRRVVVDCTSLNGVFVVDHVDHLIPN
jgi:hypothetical protein